mmetsp:Transcript_10508/g.20123  ORF Transcript_10508/g.20123 Transcript_10508/m.20123 type:complete len:166 (+) Transcript_10508:106-603(+)|eukprot:scaffold2576_cov175-Amphora_coffeaeformis.AAC.17
MILAYITVLLISALCPVAWGIVEQREVIMFSAHQSQCTRGESNCVKAIKKFVATYFDEPEEETVSGGLRRDLFTCNGWGHCDSSVPDFYLCVVFEGCGTSRNRQLRPEQNAYVNILVPPANAECYLAGQYEDSAFKDDIVAELGSQCPCVEATNFYVRICEYPDD